MRIGSFGEPPRAGQFGAPTEPAAQKTQPAPTYPSSAPAPSASTFDANARRATGTPAAQGGGRRDSDVLLMGAGCVIMLGAVVIIAAVFALRVVGSHNQPVQQPPTPVTALVAGTPVATTDPTPFPTPTTPPSIKPTPLPTWTPLPDSSSAQQVVDYRGKDAQYRQDVTRIGDFVQSSVTEINTLMQNPQPNSDHWTYQMAAQVEPWKDFFAVMQKVIPPTQYQQANDNVVKALARLDSAADDVLYAVDYNDLSQLKSAQDKIAQGTQLLKEALAGLKSTA